MARSNANANLLWLESLGCQRGDNKSAFDANSFTLAQLTLLEVDMMLQLWSRSQKSLARELTSLQLKGTLATANLVIV